MKSTSININILPLNIISIGPCPNLQAIQAFQAWQVEAISDELTGDCSKHFTIHLRIEKRFRYRQF